MTGILTSSASVKALMTPSMICWWSLTYIWIHPVSRCEMESWWSFQMVHGAPTALFTTHMTMGSLAPAAQWTCSCI